NSERLGGTRDLACEQQGTSGAMLQPISRLDAPQPSTSQQPFKYPPTRQFAEPDWRRLPAYRNDSAADWESALWQRRNTVKNLAQLKAAFGPLIPSDLLESIERDQRELATMSLLIPPQM